MVSTSLFVEIHSLDSTPIELDGPRSLELLVAHLLGCVRAELALMANRLGSLELPAVLSSVHHDLPLLAGGLLSVNALI